MSASWRQSSVLPTPVGPENRNEPVGFLLLAQTGARHLYGVGEGLHRRILAKHHALELRGQPLQAAAVGPGDILYGDARHARHHLLHIGRGQNLAAFVGGQQASGAPRPRPSHLWRCPAGIARPDSAMTDLRRRAGPGGRSAGRGGPQSGSAGPAESQRPRPAAGSATSIFWKRRDRARSRSIDGAIFLVGGGTYAAHLAAGQQGLEHVGGVHDAAGCGPGTHYHTWISSMKRMLCLRLLRCFGDGAEAFLKVAAVAGAGHQGAHVQRNKCGHR